MFFRQNRLRGNERKSSAVNTNFFWVHSAHASGRMKPMFLRRGAMINVARSLYSTTILIIIFLFSLLLIFNYKY